MGNLKACTNYTNSKHTLVLEPTHWEEEEGILLSSKFVKMSMHAPFIIK